MLGTGRLGNRESQSSALEIGPIEKEAWRIARENQDDAFSTGVETGDLAQCLLVTKGRDRQRV
jgi:hypothetical protein